MLVLDKEGDVNHIDTFDKVQRGVMTLAEWVEWINEFHHVSFDKGYHDGHQDGYDEAKEGYEN